VNTISKDIIGNIFVHQILGPGEKNLVQCSAVQCSAVQCSAVQCSAVQCSAEERCTVGKVSLLSKFSSTPEE
jgi:hypothetical protein